MEKKNLHKIIEQWTRLPMGSSFYDKGRSSTVSKFHIKRKTKEDQQLQGSIDTQEVSEHFLHIND